MAVHKWTTYSKTVNYNNIYTMCSLFHCTHGSPHIRQQVYGDFTQTGRPYYHWAYCYHYFHSRYAFLTEGPADICIYIYIHIYTYIYIYIHVCVSIHIHVSLDLTHTAVCEGSTIW